MNIISAQDELNMNLQDYSLLTDLYQLTMVSCYLGEGIANKTANFEFFSSF